MGHARSDADVAVQTGDLALPGHLTLMPASPGLVLFAHGSGSGRHSPRNRYVAGVLNEAGVSTLLLDLLSPAEEAVRDNVFDVGLLAGRLLGAMAWLAHRPSTAAVPVGLFGASTGAAAALWAAAESGTVGAVVSRGGRPDLAAGRLGRVRAPTLLIVGALDSAVLRLNRAAAREMRCEHDLAVLPGATHLFEEPGTLHAAAGLARDWFLRHLPVRTGGRQP